MTAQFEQLLELSGGFGRYQWFVYAFFMAVVLVVAPLNGFMIFGKLEPADDELCHFRNCTWYNGSGVTNETGCAEDIRFYSITMEFDLFGPRFWIQSFMISVQYTGMMLSSMITGQLADRFGRKPALVGCFVLLVCTSIGGSFSPDWQTFTGIWFCVGGLLAGAFGSLAVLCLETVPQRWRMFMNIGGWPIGYGLLAFLAYFIRNWRYLLMASNLTAPVALVLAYWINESPKWLMEKGRYNEAVKVFRRIGEWNQVENWNEDISLQMEQQLITIEQARRDLKQKQFFLSYWHLFYDWKATRVLVTIILSRIVVIGVYYGLLYNTGKLVGDVSLNLFITMVIRICFDLIIFFVDIKFKIVGRRHLFLLAMSITWFCTGYNAVAYMTNLWQIVPVTLNITAYAGICFAITASTVIHYLCLIETTPTMLRSMGDSLVTCVSRLGAILGPQTILLYGIWKAGPSVVFLIELSLVILLTYFIIPETKGKPLPDLPPKFSRNLSSGAPGSTVGEKLLDNR